MYRFERGGGIRDVLTRDWTVLAHRVGEEAMTARGCEGGWGLRGILMRGVHKLLGRTADETASGHIAKRLSVWCT